MIYDPNTATMRLSSGRTFYAYSGILGLAVDGARDAEELYFGSDGSAYPKEGTGDFTPEERQEIAAYMEDRWRRWGRTPDRDARGEVAADIAAHAHGMGQEDGLRREIEACIQGHEYKAARFQKIAETFTLPRAQRAEAKARVREAKRAAQTLRALLPTNTKEK